MYKLKMSPLNWIKTLYRESVVLASKRSKQLQFVGLIFLIIGWLLYRWFGFSESFYWRLGGLSIVTLGLLLLPQLIYPVLLIWYLVGKIIGEIVSSILISLLYFLLFWTVKLFVRVDLKPGWKSKKEKTDYTSMG